ncbi:hypothetical protein P7K49_003812, partial [Saguinus oedipus]
GLKKGGEALMSTLSKTTELAQGGAGAGPESLRFLLGKKSREGSKAQWDTGRHRNGPKFCSSQVGVPARAFQ